MVSLQNAHAVFTSNDIVEDFMPPNTTPVLAAIGALHFPSQDNHFEEKVDEIAARLAELSGKALQYIDAKGESLQQAFQLRLVPDCQDPKEWRLIFKLNPMGWAEYLPSGIRVKRIKEFLDAAEEEDRTGDGPGFAGRIEPSYLGGGPIRGGVCSQKLKSKTGQSLRCGWSVHEAAIIDFTGTTQSTATRYVPPSARGESTILSEATKPATSKGESFFKALDAKLGRGADKFNVAASVEGRSELLFSPKEYISNRVLATSGEWWTRILWVMRAVLLRVREHHPSRADYQFSSIFSEVHMNFESWESDTVRRDLAGKDACHGHVHLVFRPKEIDAISQAAPTFAKLAGRYHPPASYQESDRDAVAVRYVLRSLPQQLDSINRRLDSLKGRLDSLVSSLGLLGRVVNRYRQRARCTCAG